MAKADFARTHKTESRPSRGGTCHCGEVAHFAVPVERNSYTFFCLAHREEAIALMRYFNVGGSDPRERRLWGT